MRAASDWSCPKGLAGHLDPALPPAMCASLFDEDLEGEPDWGAREAVRSAGDAVVAARMHEAIAALSSGVPTIAVSWSYKYEGMMEQAGLGELVWDARTEDAAGLVRLFDELWARRDGLRARLARYNAAARPAVEAVVRRVAALLDAAPARERVR